jgi:hypothetical protein
MFSGCCCGDTGKEHVLTVDALSENTPAVQPLFAEQPPVSSSSQPALEAKEDAPAREVAPAPAPLPSVAEEKSAPPVPAQPPLLPKPTCQEFHVQVKKGAAGILGMELDLLDGKLGQITDIKGGIIQDYMRRPGSQQLEMLDFVVEVNQVSGDVQKLLRTLKASSNIDMLIRRAVPWRVEVHQAPGDNMVSTLNHATNGRTLLLQEVHDVFKKQWNDKQPDCPIRLYDRILEVNGVRGDPAAMLEKFQASEHLDLLLMTPAEY